MNARPRFSFEYFTAEYGSISAAARALGVATRVAQRYHSEGIPLHSTDRLAIRAGLHPMNIWPSWPHPEEEPDACALGGTADPDAALAGDAGAGEGALCDAA